VTEIKLKAGSTVTVKVSGPAIIRISPPGPPAPPLPTPALLTTEELAAYLGDVSVRTLEDWRRQGTGPDYVTLSPKMVRYRHAAVERWLDGLERNARGRTKT
jgi:predicted DNA-binding transcriptional regulator AlpA